jgi:UDP-N-acetylglucosamine 2-epimerase (non-hydrolysing)
VRFAKQASSDESTGRASAPLKIVHVVGARLNFMKIAPTMAPLAGIDGVEHSLVHTGQHDDELLSDVVFDDLDLPEPDFVLAVGSASARRA